MKRNLLTVFYDVHMGLGHRGLHALALKSRKLDLRSIPEGDLVVFINKRHDKIKVLGGKGRVVGYYNSLDGSKIMLESIQYIPKTFGGSGFNFAEAERSALAAKLVQRPHRRMSPLEASRAQARA